MHELPLVFFTVFAQSAVGLMLIAFVGQKLGFSDEVRLNRANLLAFVLTAAALLIGMFHLGQLIRAANMLMGLGRSPMSNEIVLSGLFMLLLAVTLFFSYFKKNEKVTVICNGAAIIVGLLFIWSITWVYQLNTVNNWNTNHTALQMWLTVLIGGGACALMLDIRRFGALTLLSGAAIALFTKVDYINLINQLSPQMAAEQSVFWGVQLFCLAVGAFAAGVALLKKPGFNVLVIACALAVIIGELSARIAFYNLWAISM